MDINGPLDKRPLFFNEVAHTQAIPAEPWKRRVGVLFEGWEPCPRSRFAIELGLPEKSTPTCLFQGYSV